MKKLYIVLVLFSLLCLAACGKAGSTDAFTAAPSAAAPSAEAPAAAFTGEFNAVFETLMAKTLENEPLEKGSDGKDYPGLLRGMLQETGYGASNVPVDPEFSESILGMSSEDMKKLVADSLEQKPNGSWFAHSLVLVRVTAGSDTAAVAKQILEGTSPSRFGCLKASAVSVSYAGEYILLAASSEATVQAAMEAFAALSALEVTRLDRENTWSGGGMLGGMIGG